MNVYLYMDMPINVRRYIMKDQTNKQTNKQTNVPSRLWYKWDHLELGNQGYSVYDSAGQDLAQTVKDKQFNVATYMMSDNNSKRIQY